MDCLLLIQGGCWIVIASICYLAFRNCTLSICRLHHLAAIRLVAFLERESAVGSLVSRQGQDSSSGLTKPSLVRGSANSCQLSSVDDSSDLWVDLHEAQFAWSRC